MAFKSSPLRHALTTTLQQIRTYAAPADRSIPAAKQKYIPTAGTYPSGFLAGTAHAGVKASNTTYDDVTMVVSDRPCAAAAVFTKNIFKAAPVTFSRNTLRARSVDAANAGFRGVIVNSGCANAVTGKVGLEHAAVMARATDACFGKSQTAPSDDPSEPPQTLVMSTGVIGQKLPIDKITAAIQKAHQALGADHQHWINAAQAICTTDTFPKLISRTFTLPSDPRTEYRIAGMTKGAGMIHPNMATLLGVVCTDAKIAQSAMHPFLRYAANRTFNCISIDGDTSTNDTVAFFANGAAAPAGAAPIDVPKLATQPRADPQQSRIITKERIRASMSEDALVFQDVLASCMEDLAKLVVRDGEGATKFVTIRVRSDLGYLVAKRAAVSIARSALVKTALYGKDANWGRILCAIGYAPGIMDTTELPTLPPVAGAHQVVPTRTSVSFIPADGSGALDLLVRGEPEQVDEARAKEILEMEDLEILVRLDDGPPRHAKDQTEFSSKPKQFEAVVWTCDLTHEYVTINGDYRT